MCWKLYAVIKSSTYEVTSSDFEISKIPSGILSALGVLVSVS